MLGFIIQRFLQAVLVMAVMSVIVFCGVYAIGNPIDIVIPPEATADIRAEAIRRLGLDRPLYEQYFIFISNLLQGDLGRSFVYNVPVLELIGGRLPATLELVLISVISATVLGVGLGVYAGYRPDSWVSKTIMAVSVLGFSVPSFWVGLILILFFAVNLGWLPAGGRGDTVEIWGVAWSFPTLDGLSHIVLPAVNLALFKLAMMIRLARAGTREIMLTDTIKFARAAGLSEATILRRHLLKLISIPIITVFGLELGSTLAFAVVTETIFSWPGVGKLIIDSITVLDRPVMVAYLILVAFLFVTINFVIDLVFALIDPRVRHGASA
ncbi:ABC transporter permease [Maliponia aquimaris]|uniref:Glutathione transport system permease protein GsiC n=1 Tax=Maliponia aquimaris TaxID=1673631 RepID=A0A238L0J0_9RHOB|nr:ABC transporter permease [Maliponia aquimaris]SMX47952.1 Glutathione transport system permease protein GsiC [Maliponia aquimaris]